MIGNADNPVLSRSDYNRIMGKLSSQYEMLKECPDLGANYARGLLNNLNPTLNPGGSSGMLGGLERIINQR